MEDIKAITAENISKLRVANDMTQAELAKKLNYSDKAISKWERGESLPDVVVLKQIADMFGVTLDFLTSEQKEIVPVEKPQYKWMSKNHMIITALSVIGVWFIATVVYVAGAGMGKNLWLAFPVAVPCSLIVLLVMNSVWGKLKFDLYIISALVWTTLGVAYLSMLERNFWILFCIGIPLQLAAILAFNIRKPKKPTAL